MTNPAPSKKNLKSGEDPGQVTKNRRGRPPKYRPLVESPGHGEQGDGTHKPVTLKKKILKTQLNKSLADPGPQRVLYPWIL